MTISLLGYILRPRYDLYGRAAPLKRNEQMVDMADEVLVIWDGHSRGTKYTLNYIKKQNKKTTLITGNRIVYTEDETAVTVDIE